MWGELCPRVGFIVTNLARRAVNIVAFYNKRGTCEQYIKEGKGAINWTRLSCRSFAANAVRLQLHALAYNLGNFLRTLATPELIKERMLTTLKEKLFKIGARVVHSHPLRRFPDDGGPHSGKPIRRHPADDRGASAAASLVDGVSVSAS